MTSYHVIDTLSVQKCDKFIEQCLLCKSNGRRSRSPTASPNAALATVPEEEKPPRPLHPGRPQSGTSGTLSDRLLSLAQASRDGKRAVKRAAGGILRKAGRFSVDGSLSVPEMPRYLRGTEDGGFSEWLTQPYNTYINPITRILTISE